MTEMSRERREELLHVLPEPGDTVGFTLPDGTDMSCAELRALLRDSAWRERVEREVRELADESERRGRNGEYEQFRDDPTYAESARRSAYKRIAAKLRAIVDTGDEEGV